MHRNEIHILHTRSDVSFCFFLFFFATTVCFFYEWYTSIIAVASVATVGCYVWRRLCGRRPCFPSNASVRNRRKWKKKIKTPSTLRVRGSRARSVIFPLGLLFVYVSFSRRKRVRRPRAGGCERAARDLCAKRRTPGRDVSCHRFWSRRDVDGRRCFNRFRRYDVVVIDTRPRRGDADGPDDRRQYFVQRTPSGARTCACIKYITYACVCVCVFERNNTRVCALYLT